MPKFEEFEKWVKARPGRQAQLAKDLGIPGQQGKISKWINGTGEEITPDFRKKLGILGYEGPWPEEAGTGMPADDAVQRAYFILEEVQAASPRLREGWEREDRAEFLAGVTKLLIAAPKPELAEGLRALLVHVAKDPLPKRRAPAGAE